MAITEITEGLFLSLGRTGLLKASDRKGEGGGKRATLPSVRNEKNGERI